MTRSRLRCIIESLTAVLLLLISVLITLDTAVACSRLEKTPTTDDAHLPCIVVSDRPARPLTVSAFQTDAAWAGQPYLGGTIETHGCGLCCASVALSWLSYEEITPLELAQRVGTTCSTDGVNDMGKFAALLSDMTGCRTSQQLWVYDAMLGQRVEDSMVFAGVNGYVGSCWYDSHVVLLYGVTDDGAELFDPASPENTKRYTSDELRSFDFVYFYVLSP